MKVKKEGTKLKCETCKHQDGVKCAHPDAALPGGMQPFILARRGETMPDWCPLRLRASER